MMVSNLNYDIRLKVLFMDHGEFIESYDEYNENKSINDMLLNGFLIFDYNKEHLK